MSLAAVTATREQRLREDAEARILAQTVFDRPVVLEAGAGTGKTTALVSRVVIWALGPGWMRSAKALELPASAEGADLDRIAARTLQRIVAITFTDAAAAEMARRIGEALAKVAEGAAANVLAGQLGLHLAALPAEASVRARALVGSLDRLVVRTLHAFARRLLAAHPIEAGLHPAFDVDADGSGAAEVVRQLLEPTLRAAYGDPGDPVLLALAARGITASKLERELLALVNAGVSATLLAEDPVDARAVDALRRSLLEQLERFRTLFGGGVFNSSRTSKAADAVRAALEASQALEAPALGGAAGLAALQTPIRALFESRLLKVFAEWGRGKATDSELAVLGEGAAAFAPLCATIHATLAYLCRLDPEILDLARRALHPLLTDASEALRVRGLVSYDQLLSRAASLLEEHPAITQRLRGEIDQLLVDEFQDTDARQCVTISALALDGPPGARPGLFLVGDPKQSIYAWRGADLGAYHAFVERVKAARGQALSLCVNYRSLQHVLDEVDRVIAPIMNEATGIQPRFQPLLASRSGVAPSGPDVAAWAPVEYWISRAAPRESGATTSKAAANALEARAIARDIARLLREERVKPSEIGILFRAFGDVETYLSALREAGVPYAVTRDRSYYRRREIIDATCLLRCVLDPADHVALVTFLRSSAVGVPDAALLPLWHRRLPTLVGRLPRDADATLAQLRACVESAAAALPDGVPGIERARGFAPALMFALEALCALRQSFVSDSSDLFVEKLRSFLLFEQSEAARPLGSFRLANLDRFFREVEAALSGGEDPAALLRTLRRKARDEAETEEARPLETAAEAVQVLSIHKAKGLGFAHTYVVQLHKGKGRVGDRPAQARRVAGRVELRLLQQATPGSIVSDAREAMHAAAEHVRTLYVAMTRAKNRLVLAGLWPEVGSRTTVTGSFVPLLQTRESGVLPIDATFDRLRAEKTSDHHEENGARWVFPALRIEEMIPADEEAVAQEILEPSSAALVGRATADREQLFEARGVAALRARRSFGGPASKASHEAMRDSLDRRREGSLVDRTREPERSGAADARALATAVGTAIHRALETLDLDPGNAASLEHAVVTLEATLEAQLGGDALEAARRRSEAVWKRFVSGPLLLRLRSLAAHVVARELPILLAPDSEGEGPTGYVAGAIDLLYRDPESGLPVIVDYKTDAIEGDAEIEGRSALYAAQGAHYVRAVREALGLAHDPRFELWFLSADAIVPVTSG